MIFEIIIAALLIVLFYFYVKKYNTVLIPASTSQMENVHYQYEKDINL